MKVVIAASVLVAGWFCCTGVLQADDGWIVSSPNGKLVLAAVQKASAARSDGKNGLCYQVKLDGKEVLPDAPMGIALEGDGGEFVSDLTFVKASEGKIDETYSMPVGKKSLHINRANEKTLVFTNRQGRTIEVYLRAYDDGVAWRYGLPGSGNTKLKAEASAFHLPAGSIGWLQPWTEHYEQGYGRTDPKAADNATIAFPALFKTAAGVWVMFTEAAVYSDYAGSRLHGPLSGSGLYQVQPFGVVNVKLPLTTPWRVILLGRGLGAIVESVLVDNLNPPCEIKDTSWIKPGAAVFPWWSEPGNGNKTPERMKVFVDFAAEMGWSWLEFDTAWNSNPRDVWMTTPWMEQLVKYAGQKGVSVYGWDEEWNMDTPEKRAKVLDRFVGMGIKGLKLDYMNRQNDTQDRVKLTEDNIKDCLARHLMISVHGSTIPRGEQRRWPHLITREGVFGAEHYSIGPFLGLAWHNCTLPFTRNVVGSMDYTPVAFSVKGRETTDAHELALSVIFESGWQCLADSPESFRSNPGTPFLKNLPAAWDDIHFIEGFPREYCVLARRKGSAWYVAGINEATPRDLLIPLDFLKRGAWSVALYRDGADGRKLVVENIQVNSRDGMKIHLPPNGGFAVKFAK